MLFSNQIRCVVLVKLNLQMKMFVYHKEKRKINCGISEVLLYTYIQLYYAHSIELFYTMVYKKKLYILYINRYIYYTE